MTKIGTLEELNVKPGDVVEFQGWVRPICTVGVSIYGKLIDVDDGEELCEYMPFRIVSRASDTQDTKIGTLAEIGAKPGDVVEWGGKTWIVSAYSERSDRIHALRGEEWISGSAKGCRIVSRASDKPKLWRDMTPEEKGALLLAAHEGKVIEWTGSFGSEFDMDSIRGTPVWSNTHAYRIKPEPKVETVTLYGSPSKHIQWVLEECILDTHRITFNLIDGEPDCTSIKMEKL